MPLFVEQAYVGSNPILHPHFKNMLQVQRAGHKIVKKAWGYELWIENTERYCGKILHFNAGGRFSLHFHIKKEETWYVSKGSFELVCIDTSKGGKHYTVLKQGDIVHIMPGEPHQLIAKEESEIFEVSTQHFDYDSYRIEMGDSQK